MAQSVKLAVLGIIAFLVASPNVGQPAAEEANEPAETFGAPLRSFADQAACIRHLAALVASSAPPSFDAAVGPYRIAAGDMRAHRVRGRDWGHEIEEYRCLGTELSERRWTHSMADVKPFTIDDIANMNFPAP